MNGHLTPEEYAALDRVRLASVIAEFRSDDVFDSRDGIDPDGWETWDPDEYSEPMDWYGDDSTDMRDRGGAA